MENKGTEATVSSLRLAEDHYDQFSRSAVETIFLGWSSYLFRILSRSMMLGRYFYFFSTAG